MLNAQSLGKIKNVEKFIGTVNLKSRKWLEIRIVDP